MTVAVVLLLWVVCGGISAWLAWTKGRSVGAWFLCGLVFGVFGVIAAALARDQTSINAPRLSRHRSKRPPCPPPRDGGGGQGQSTGEPLRGERRQVVDQTHDGGREVTA
jgi:hypothetical protein